MKDQTFKAFVVDEPEKGKFTRNIKDRTVSELPEGDVLVKVAYSSLNYKDGLSSIGNKGVTKNYPHTPGIDASGVIEETNSDTFRKGEEVIITSYDLGMNTAGGFGQYIRVPADWVVKLPPDLSLKEAMIFGTAGFTAGMSIYPIVEKVKPEDGDILVTGATGGVGSVSVAILARLGYSVVAVSGKANEKEFLNSLGAKEIISREEATDTSDRPMLRSRWAGVVDTVGGEILATAIKAANPWSVVTCCGLVASPDLPINVMPFILRGVQLIGIDSQNCPMHHRTEVWSKLANEWKIDQLADMSKEIGLEELSDNIDLILKGQQKGRVVVNLGNTF